MSRYDVRITRACMAEACGMTLIAIARKDGFEIFTHPRRVKTGIAIHVA